MFEAGYNLTGFRVCVRWLPIRGRDTSLANSPLVHALAVLTCSAIGPVNTNPAYNLIPKNEIIWHIQSPTFAEAGGFLPPMRHASSSVRTFACSASASFARL